jgi:cell division protein FtsN
VSPDKDDFLEEEEQQEYAPRSIFAAGWFRAVLVLTVLAIVVVVSLPYLLNWFEPSPSAPPKTAARQSLEPAKPSPQSEPMIPATPGQTSSAPVKSEAPPPAAPPVSATSPALSPSAKPTPDTTAPAAPAPSTQAQTQPSPATPSKPLLQPPASKPDAARRTAAIAPKAEPGRPAPTGAFYVQVGLFKESRNADALAKTLRDEGFSVEVTRVSRGSAPGSTAPPHHELYITGSSVEAVNAALKGRGVAHSVQGGVSVRPAYDLKQATALSKELSAEGLHVIIRRAGGNSADTFTVVRVGGFPDRAKASAVREDLQGKGHAGFVTQGASK